MKTEQQLVQDILDLGCIEVTTKNQRTRGTTAFEMKTGKKIVEYSSGYVRIIYGHMWPINKRNSENNYCNNTVCCVLIRRRIDRLRKIKSYLRKNYVDKYRVCGTEVDENNNIIKYKYERIR